MRVVFFIFGIPGSGKSTAARYAEEIMKRREGWSVYRISDYEILYDWFRNGSERGDFRPIAYDGFDILNDDIYDEALQELRSKVQANRSHTSNEFVIIEFARCEYTESLQFFEEFLHDAYFLFLDTDIETCKKRVGRRAHNPVTLDDHFVSQYIFDLYEAKPNYIASNLSDLKTNYRIESRSIQVIDNCDTRTLKDFLGLVEQSLSSAIDQRVLLSLRI